MTRLSRRLSTVTADGTHWYFGKVAWSSNLVEECVHTAIAPSVSAATNFSPIEVSGGQDFFFSDHLLWMSIFNAIKAKLFSEYEEY
ncbi:hypothetical protein MSG28_005143 [Choristoneura fumiferana]|uniref:Uncharacterized protein n=1 Tax=Choristoneura fumiferana TaxID=7141 RepID=A0ACC0JQ24_CHOFU|nr:hypothetical protein MSG28_005143 [Choristoneura fumiferana]